MNNKTFLQFMNDPSTYLVIIFNLFLLGVGVHQAFTGSVPLGLGMALFFSFIISIFLKERYNKYRDLYK